MGYGLANRRSAPAEDERIDFQLWKLDCHLTRHCGAVADGKGVQLAHFSRRLRRLGAVTPLFRPYKPSQIVVYRTGRGPNFPPLIVASGDVIGQLQIVTLSDIGRIKMVWGKKTSLRSGQHGPGKAKAWEAEIKSKVEDLRQLEKQAFGPRHGKTDFYEYLKGIYNACNWTDLEEAARLARRVAKVYKLDARKNKGPILTLIDATSKQDRQVKSRWTVAIEYGVAQNARGTALKKFLEKNGGVAGCAKKRAALRRRKLGRGRPQLSGGRRGDDRD
jgi:hypothetical protein